MSYPSWYHRGGRTHVGSTWQMRRAGRKLGILLRRDMLKHPWLYVALALAYILIRILMEVVT